MIRYTVQENENAFAKYIGKKITLGLGDFIRRRKGTGRRRRKWKP